VQRTRSLAAVALAVGALGAAPLRAEEPAAKPDAAATATSANEATFDTPYGPAPEIDAPPEHEAALTPTVEDMEALDERLDTVEKELALIRHKFRVLAAEDEAEVLGRELLDSPRWLFDAALQQESTVEGLERAYRYFALVRQLHPESPEARDAFLYAARIHRFLFRAHRVRDPHSPWVVSEPTFMIHWLADFFEPGRFPDTEVNVFAWKLPMSTYRKLEDYAKTHPEMRKWRLEVEEDNGRVEVVRGFPMED